MSIKKEALEAQRLKIPGKYVKLDEKYPLGIYITTVSHPEICYILRISLLFHHTLIEGYS